MTLLPPAWLQNGENYSANNDRLAVFSSIIETVGVTEKNGMYPRPTNPASMTVNITEGHAFVRTGLEGQGLYSVVNVGLASVVIPPAHSTLDRWDLIVLTVRDSDITGTADEAVFEVIPGTPGSNPTAPTYSGNSIVIGLVVVRRGTGAINRSDIRVEGYKQQAALSRSLGASVFPVNNPAQLSTLVYHYHGMISAERPLVVFRTDAPRGRELQYTINGSAWIPVNEAPAPKRVELHGAGPSLVGGSATNADGFLMQAGTTAHKSSVTGDARVTLPKAFPNGLLSVVLTNGHHEVTGTLIYDLLPEHPSKGHTYKYEKNAFVYRIHDAKGNVKKNFQHRVNWIAVGW